MKKVPGPGAYQRGVEELYANPSYSVPQYLKDTARPLPIDKTAAAQIGPGQYHAENRFDDIGWRRSQALLRAARNMRETESAAQYSHIFRCITPKASKIVELTCPEQGSAKAALTQVAAA